MTLIRTLIPSILLLLLLSGCDDGSQCDCADGPLPGDSDPATECDSDSECPCTESIDCDGGDVCMTGLCEDDSDTATESTDTAPGDTDTADTDLPDSDTSVPQDTDTPSDAVMDMLFVDVRTVGEYDGGHYQDAINIPVADLASRTDELLPLDRPITVYCASGARATQAYGILETAGFTNVTNGGALSSLP